MRQDIKEKWLKDLRSGRFLQASNTLRERATDHRYAYCCLGVLCNVIDRNSWMRREDHCRATPDQEMPAPDILDKADVGARAASKLAKMNDSGKSFAVIADWIETHL